eukprot:scaffold204058_cov31-Tisochrysis_lutea.AAC.2
MGQFPARAPRPEPLPKLSPCPNGAVVCSLLGIRPPTAYISPSARSWRAIRARRLRPITDCVERAAAQHEHVIEAAERCAQHHLNVVRKSGRGGSGVGSRCRQGEGIKLVHGHKPQVRLGPQNDVPTASGRHPLAVAICAERGGHRGHCLDEGNGTALVGGRS